MFKKTKLRVIWFPKIFSCKNNSRIANVHLSINPSEIKTSHFSLPLSVSIQRRAILRRRGSELHRSNTKLEIYFCHDTKHKLISVYLWWCVWDDMMYLGPDTGLPRLYCSLHATFTPPPHISKTWTLLQAEKLKSRKIKGWRMLMKAVMKVISAVWGVAFRWTNEWTDICDCRVAFVTENEIIAQ